MNYREAEDFAVSAFIDSSIEDASCCFCLMSDSVPEPDRIFNPSLRMFLAAFTSLS
jgi:hypothetical protein